MEDKRNITDEEFELAMLWAAEDGVNYFGCGQYSTSK
jgi:hypothetical protein